MEECKLKIWIALLFCVMCVVPVEARDVNIPDTPVGKRLKEMLSIIEANDKDKTLAFIRAFDPSFSEGFTEEEHLNVFKDMSERTGGLDIVEIRNSEKTDLVVIAKARKTQRLLRVLLQTTSNEPYAITDIGVRPVDEQERPAGNVIQGEEIPDKEARLRRMDEYLKNLKDLHGGVLIAHNGTIIFNKYYGFANREAATQNTPDTVFDIASATKDFTHTAILQFAAQGKLSMKDPLSKYFPGIPGDKANITIQQLLDHTAGFPDHSGEDGEKITKEEFLERIFATKLLFEPGNKESY